VIELQSLASIEHLFSTMQPTDLRGQPFIPAIHPADLTADREEVPEEDDFELAALDRAALGPFQSFAQANSAASMVAIDAGVLEVGVSKTGYALALKASVIEQNINGIVSIAVLGPRVKFITPTNRAEILAYIGEQLLAPDMFVERRADGSLTIKAGAREPNQFKDRLRNYLERMLQLDAARQLTSGILLVDGALTLRTFNTPGVFLEQLSREARRRNSDIVGVSKKSRVTVDGVHVSALLDDIAAGSVGFMRINRLDSEDGEERTLGTPFAVRFSPGGFTFRVDVSRESLLPTEEEVLQTLYSNTPMMLGYPNLLRLAHIHSAFTKSEIVSLQVAAAHDFEVSMRPPEDVSVIFAPFRKGIGG
jgi:hypothetical protein